MNNKIKKRNRRKKSIRKKVSGTQDRPRMCVHKSNKNLYIQIVNDIEGKTLCGVSTTKAGDDAKQDTRKNIKFAALLGEEIAKTAISKGIKKVVFDRGGYLYHGSVKALAEAARKGGLEF